MQIAKSRVTNEEIVEKLLQSDHRPEELNHHIIEGAWFELKEARGWRPRWNVRDGLLANGMPTDAPRIERICELYLEAFTQKGLDDDHLTTRIANSLEALRAEGRDSWFVDLETLEARTYVAGEIVRCLR